MGATTRTPSEMAARCRRGARFARRAGIVMRILAGVFIVFGIILLISGSVMSGIMTISSASITAFSGLNARGSAHVYDETARTYDRLARIQDELGRLA